MIEQRKISAISNATALDGNHRISESVIERDYCLSWFLIGLSHFPIREKLIFKGGTALRRCYFRDYRYSEDLDFTLAEPIGLEIIQNSLQDVFDYIKDETGIFFGIGRTEPPSVNTYTFYLTYDGPLPGKIKEVKTDITFKEIILRPVQDKKIIKSFDEYSDFEEDAQIRVYSLEEVMIEKVCALLSPARNEPRDLYDIWYLIEEQNFEFASLLDDICAKSQFKGYNFKTQRIQLEKKELRLKKLWSIRLATQMTTLPEFDDVFRSVKRAFRKTGIT